MLLHWKTLFSFQSARLWQCVGHVLNTCPLLIAAPNLPFWWWHSITYARVSKSGGDRRFKSDRSAFLGILGTQQRPFSCIGTRTLRDVWLTWIPPKLCVPWPGVLRWFPYCPAEEAAPCNNLFWRRAIWSCLSTVALLVLEWTCHGHLYHSISIYLYICIYIYIWVTIKTPAEEFFFTNVWLDYGVVNL